jgi:signal peptidase II
MEMEFLIIIIGIIIDRLTKLWAINRLAPDRDMVIIKDFFTFSYVENRGAAFGIFQHRVNLLAVVTIVIIAGMIYYLIKNRQETLLFRISMAMIISGAIGNLIDRIQYKFVVDFILVHYKTAHFPNFNIADVLVVIGTALLSIYIIKDVK